MNLRKNKADDVVLAETHPSKFRDYVVVLVAPGLPLVSTVLFLIS